MLRRYARWLHLDVPAGRVERGPVVRPDGTTGLPGVFVVGDLTGVPLLKFACDTGAAAVGRIPAAAPEGELDLVILGGGVAGMAAALEAHANGLRFLVLEASAPFSTIVNFPRQKPIFTYPAAMRPRGTLQVGAPVKEELLQELLAQVEGVELPVVLGVSAAGLRRAGPGYEIVLEKDANPRPWRGDRLPPGWALPLRARHVIVALGRSGSHRRLEVSGEELPKVYNRLHDPAKSCGTSVLVVGGGDSAMETAVALADCGSQVTLSYRGRELARPKPANVAAVKERPIELLLESRVKEIRPDSVVVEVKGEARTLPNDSVFTMLGRNPPLAFFRRSGLPILGEMTRGKWLAMSAFLLFCTLLYAWKGGLIRSGLDAIAWRDAKTLVGATVNAAKDPSFHYTLAYSLCIVIFGLRRIRRRKTRYVTVQTYTLMAVQVLPLFLLPQILLPWLDANGWMPDWIERTFFPGASWWRAYGLVLAWPLFFWNLATSQPLWGWLVLSLVQTGVIIPLLVRRWGKGAYCGWICSCGALAETLGDTHRHKMWHGPTANRWNLAGQVILAFALAAFGWRVLGWALPAGNLFARSFAGVFADPWKIGVDLVLAGILGLGLYFWFSGRVWCRFFCPLAALMHVYTKATRYRIFAEQDKCISCNVCTTVCHQGIDVMSYANKGRPMTDVECVRCSACVQECPTGTLSFGQADGDGKPSRLDRLAASPVHLREGEDRDRILARLQAQPTR
ncbi:MAG: NAD(P)-binding domain-containing protein [Planctomycetota bacterium]|jgi:thioredoxin reductase/Fe-S-cluster-containing hydrogenase component 2